MKVKIFKTKFESMWYAKKLGKTYEVETIRDKDMWMVVGDPRSDGSRCFIYKEDCEEIKMEEIVNQSKLFKVVDSRDILSLSIKDSKKFKAVVVKDPLKVSIEKWGLISETVFKEGRFIYDGAINTCGLCNEYYDLNCRGCPVMLKTEEPCCNGSPYVQYHKTNSGGDFDAALGFKHAYEEYLFLKSLRK